jgi:hypothetical protein
MLGELLGDAEADAGRAAEDAAVLAGGVHLQRQGVRSISGDTVDG